MATQIRKSVTIGRPLGEVQERWRGLEDLPAFTTQCEPERFVELRHGRGTELHVVLEYDPPGGPVGEAVGPVVGKVLGHNPEQHVADQLRRFKALLEAGEVPSTAGQPSGRGKRRRRVKSAGTRPAAA